MWKCWPFCGVILSATNGHTAERNVPTILFIFLLIASLCFMCNCDCRVKLYGCEIWSHTLREEHRLRVFEDRVLSRIFGPKRDEVTREWRKLHHEELNTLRTGDTDLRFYITTVQDG